MQPDVAVKPSESRFPMTVSQILRPYLGRKVSDGTEIRVLRSSVHVNRMFVGMAEFEY
jgi:hypothetical protein